MTAFFRALGPESLVYLYALSIPLSISASAVAMMALLLFFFYRYARTLDNGLVPRDFWLFVAVFVWQSVSSMANGLWGQFGRNLWDKTPYLTVGSLKLDKRVLVRVLWILLWTNLLVIAYGLLQKYADFPVLYREMFSADGRFRGFSSHPLRFCGYLSTVGILALSAALFYSRKAYLFFAVISSGVLMTGSRTYMISYLLACAALAFLRSRLAFVRFVYSGVIGLTLLMLAYPPIMARTAATFAMGHDVIRYRIWDVAWKAYVENPVFGLGPRQLPGYMAPYAESGYTVISSHAHNIYLNALAEEGPVGLMLLTALLVHFLLKYFRGARAAADPVAKVYAAGLFAATVNLVVSGMFESHFYTFITWSLMTFLMGLYEASGRNKAGVRP